MDMLTFLDEYQNSIEKPEEEPVSWRISAYACVLSEKNEILMVLPNGHSLWGLPGGGVDLEESILDGVVRECFEETRYNIKPLATIPLYMKESNFYCRVTKRFFHSVIMVFPASLVHASQAGTNNLKGAEYEEIEKISWVNMQDLHKGNCHPIIWPVIEMIQSR